MFAYHLLSLVRPAYAKSMHIVGLAPDLSGTQGGGSVSGQSICGDHLFYHLLAILQSHTTVAKVEDLYYLLLTLHMNLLWQLSITYHSILQYSKYDS